MQTYNPFQITQTFKNQFLNLVIGLKKTILKSKDDNFSNVNMAQPLIREFLDLLLGSYKQGPTFNNRFFRSASR